MKKKIYTFILILLMGGLASARAQNPSSPAQYCNAAFATVVDHQQVTFFAIDSQANVSHFWSFGDTTQQGYCHCASVSHTYSSSRVYTVTHIVRDSLGRCSDSTTDTVSVNPPPPPPACFISFEAIRDSSGNVHSYNLFANAPWPALPGDTVSWYINGSFAGIGLSLPHHYIPGPSSTICVYLTRASGCLAQQCAVIPVDSLAACTMPSFSYQADSSNPKLIRFTAFPDNDSLHYFWNFGDGPNGSLSPTPSHLYDSIGVTYDVTLRITGFSGTDSCNEQIVQGVYIPGPPPPPADTCSASFTYTRNPAMPNEISFSAHSTMTLDSVFWSITNIADSGQFVYLSGTNPTYIFPDSGSYIVYMTAFGHPCIAYSSQVISIDSLGSAASSISSYPNPTSNMAYVDVRLPGADKIYINVFNSMGKQVLTKVVTGYADMNHIGLPISGLQNGIYYVRIQYGNVVKQSKIRKL